MFKTYISASGNRKSFFKAYIMIMVLRKHEKTTEIKKNQY